VQETQLHHYGEQKKAGEEVRNKEILQLVQSFRLAQRVEVV
jgi:hypothetical protein